MAKRKLGKMQQRKDFMHSKSWMKYIVIPCMLVIIATGIYSIWYLNMQNSSMKNIEYIRSFMSSSGKLNDYSNKLGMHDPEKDIKWYKTDKEIRIEFGRIYMTWEPEDFYSDEVQEALGSIGFTTEIKKNKEGVKVLHLYYMGKEVERWIK